jgi:hypothetical protein
VDLPRPQQPPQREEIMRRPERLVFFHSELLPDEETTFIEALFVDMDIPILFRARLPFEEREFYSDVFSTNEGSVDYFSREELLDACFCSGALNQEQEEKTDEVVALIERCDHPSDNNDF